MDNTKALNEAHKKWQDERGGIGFACFNSSGEQERAFAKADNIFAFAVDQILRTALSEQGEAAQPAADGWRTMDSAPKNATEIILRIPCKGWPTHYRVIGHWAQDLSGSEQPPFRGWFRNTGYGFAEIPDPDGWMPLPSPAIASQAKEPKHADDCPWDKTRLTLQRRCTCGIASQAEEGRE